jgi:predicted amidohydrolase
MSSVRIALANLHFPSSDQESLFLVTSAMEDAARQDVDLICFPECYVPGYRGLGDPVAEPDAEFLIRAHRTIADSAAANGVAVIVGIERIIEDKLFISAMVVAKDGEILGFQDKVQLDPSEDEIYSPGCKRHIFQSGPLTFGIVICHEGWRYPETVRWATRNGAQIVFHPHYHPADPSGGHVPSTFAEQENTFHEKAILCRAAENTCYFASVNYATPDAPTTSAIARPDGTLQCHQPYGKEGLLIADIDLSLATRLLATRFKPPQE